MTDIVPKPAAPAPTVAAPTLEQIMNDAVSKRQTKHTLTASANAKGVLIQIAPTGDPGAVQQYYVKGNEFVAVA